MSRYSAEEFSRAGEQFLGRSYDEMDCQEFVERCLECVGCLLDLKGSNAWYRKVQQEGWTGTPEECVREFGCVPKGALLFIHAFDGGEERRGYHDGKGNASHIGIKTGRGKGAIHSSSSRGCVAESEFHDRTVRNGGWNRVGLWNRMDYGKTVNWAKLLRPSVADASQELRSSETSDLSGGPSRRLSLRTKEHEEELKRMTVTVTSPNGGPVNLRKAANKGAALVDRILPGTEAELLESAGEWSRIRVAGRTGWMMAEFLVTDGDAVPAEPADTYCVIISGLDLTQAQAICNNYPGRSTMEVVKG